jgi:hypothetical protein
MAQKCSKCGRNLKFDKINNKFVCQYCNAGTRELVGTAGFWESVEKGVKPWKKCPSCGKANEPDNNYCIHCGASFKGGGARPTQATARAGKPTQTVLDTWMQKKCPKCGKNNDPNNNFCIYCGAPLKGGAPTTAQPPSATSAPSGGGGRGGRGWAVRKPIMTNTNIIFIIIAYIVAFVSLGPLSAFTVIVKIYIIAGLAVANFVIFNPGAKFGTFIILLPLLFLFFGQTPLGQSILEQIGLSEYFSDLYLSLKYAGCYLGNAFNVNVLSVGNLEQFCQKQTYGFRAEKEGCIECLDFTVSPKTTAVPNRPLIVESELSIQSNANAPAKNIVLRATDLDTGKEAEITNSKCGVEKPCQLSKGDDPVLVRFKLDIPCKSHLQYKVIVSYDYVVQGDVEFKIRQETEKATTMPGGVTGRSSSGPLSFGIQSDSAEYVVGEERDVYVNFYLYNEGKGKIRPKTTTVKQIAPNRGEELEFIECEGFVKFSEVDKTTFTIEQFDSIPIRGSDLVTCKFKLPESIKAPFLTYKFIGVTEYSYELERKDSIPIDLLNYPCKITTGRWKVYSGKPADNWYEESFYDDSWGMIDLPDKDWGCNDCTRYYRKYVYWNEFDKVELKVKSDDGAACYVNGKNVFDDLGGAHDAGKKNCDILKGKCEEWDYVNDITDLLNKKVEGKAAKSVIACAVHNNEGKSYFEATS